MSAASVEPRQTSGTRWGRSWTSGGPAWTSGGLALGLSARPPARRARRNFVRRRPEADAIERTEVEISARSSPEARPTRPLRVRLMAESKRSRWLTRSVALAPVAITPSVNVGHRSSTRRVSTRASRATRSTPATRMNCIRVWRDRHRVPRGQQWRCDDQKHIAALLQYLQRFSYGARRQELARVGRWLADRQDLQRSGDRVSVARVVRQPS